MLEKHFGSLEDFRDLRGSHNLLEVLTIAILATICGTDEFTDMDEFGKAKECFLHIFSETA